MLPAETPDAAGQGWASAKASKAAGYWTSLASRLPLLPFSQQAETPTVSSATLQDPSSKLQVSKSAAAPTEKAYNQRASKYDDHDDDDDGCGALGSAKENALEQHIANALVQETYHRGSTDNIAVIAVLLQSRRRNALLSSTCLQPSSEAQETTCNLLEENTEPSLEICKSSKPSGSHQPHGMPASDHLDAFAAPQQNGMCSGDLSHTVSHPFWDTALLCTKPLGSSLQAHIGGYPFSPYMYELLSHLQKRHWHVHAQLMLPLESGIYKEGPTFASTSGLRALNVPAMSAGQVQDVKAPLQLVDRHLLEQLAMVAHDQKFGTQITLRHTAQPSSNEQPRWTLHDSDQQQTDTVKHWLAHEHTRSLSHAPELLWLSTQAQHDMGHSLTLTSQTANHANIHSSSVMTDGQAPAVLPPDHQTHPGHSLFSRSKETKVTAAEAGMSSWVMGPQLGQGAFGGVWRAARHARWTSQTSKAAGQQGELLDAGYHPPQGDLMLASLQPLFLARPNQGSQIASLTP